MLIATVSEFDMVTVGSTESNTVLVFRREGDATPDLLGAYDRYSLAAVALPPCFIPSDDVVAAATEALS